MRRVVIILFLGLLFIGVSIYIMTSQSPFIFENAEKIAEENNLLTDNVFAMQIDYFIDRGLIWDILNKRLLATFLLCVCAGIIFTLSGLHLFLDKLFFRKFYEEPKLFPAFRRSTLLCLIFLGYVFFRFINGLVWYNMLAYVVLLVCIEILFIGIARTRKKREGSAKSNIFPSSLSTSSTAASSISISNLSASGTPTSGPPRCNSGTSGASEIVRDVLH